MTVSTTTDAPVDLEVDLLLVPFTTAPPDSFIQGLSAVLGSAVDRVTQDFEANAGDSRVLYPENTRAPRVALLGLGSASSLDAEALRTATAAGAEVALDHEADRVACLFPLEGGDGDAQTALCLVEGFVLGTYCYRRYKTADGFEGPSAFLLHVGDTQDETAVAEGARRGATCSKATSSARDLVNRSPNEKTAREFADAVGASGAAHGYDVETWEKDRIREEGMGGLLAVNRGSFEPPTFGPPRMPSTSSLSYLWGRA